MTIPNGFRQIGSLDLLQAIEEERTSETNSQEARGRKAQMRAQAYAQVCGMHRIGISEMSPSQRAYAEAVFRRMQGEGTSDRYSAFRLPEIELRKPNLP